MENHIKEICGINPGEIILTSINHDGMMGGYDIKNIRNISHISSVPVIASGGAGNPEDFYDVIKITGVKAVSAASIFHFTEITPLDVKRFLNDKKIPVRL